LCSSSNQSQEILLNFEKKKTSETNHSSKGVEDETKNWAASDFHSIPRKLLRGRPKRNPKGHE
jgi:hypothetical protein